jgi:hypothetical protein
MGRYHPQPYMNIPISYEIWQKLISGSFDSRYEKEDWEIAAEAIEAWTRKKIPDAIPMPAAGGYQWKSLFLATGTLLRTVFGGKNYHCTVEGDQILYNGKPVSPSGFVNAVGGIRRNAWRCTWILFPDSKDWKLADTLRTRERPRRARKPARDIQQTPAPAATRPAASVPPAANPSPQQMEPIAGGAPVRADLQHAIHDQAPRTESSGERRNRQQRTGINLSPPGFTRGTGRRANGEDRMTTMLRQELLPLLYRMCACDAMAPSSESCSAQSMPQRRNWPLG